MQFNGRFGSRTARLACSISILALAASLSACGGGDTAGGDATGSDAASGGTANGENVSGEIQIDGSSTVFPIAEAMAEDNDEAARKTRRLRRKIARVLLDISHVHFFNNDLDAAMASCKEAMTLIDEHMTGVTMAAAWYNMSMIFHHQKRNEQALACLTKFFNASSKLIDNDHIQRGDAMHLKGEILLDMGKQSEAVEALDEALRIRKIKFGETSGILVETLTLLGKAQLALGQTDAGIQSLEQSLELERKSNQGAELTFEAAQCMLDLARGYQIKGNIEAALAKYLEVIGWARTFFGEKHPFTGRIANIIGSLYNQLGKVAESQQFLQEAAQVVSA